ncbi:MAG: cobalt ABC transporter [Cyanobacteria bacterium SW_9_44_58]|nr:MAG: cobalt ABC transporter [Cyanobacteria bacterium SW_9_44_58]
MTINSEIILEADQVSLTDQFGFSNILKDISFQIKKRDRASLAARGDRVAILGTSGSGKTSLLRLLNRLSEPTTGNLFFAGTSYDSISVISLRQQVVLVPQEPKLLGMTVRETLAYPLTLQKLSKTEINHRIATYSDQLQIPESWYDKSELQLSLGQRQLVTIARGLIMEPQVLLLDEPTSALDIATATRVINVLKEQETTILMVNHQLELAEQFCDRVLYLQEGTLIQDRFNINLDWQQLKQDIIEAEHKIEQEWG